MIDFDAKYLNFKDTLTCGQTFRFYESAGGYTVLAGGNVAFVRNEGGRALIKSTDDNFFKEYFDLDRDYGKIVDEISLCNNVKVVSVSQRYCGIRILKQIREEAFFSFMISQNNNIPRIIVTIEKLATALGDDVEFEKNVYKAFPKTERLAEVDLDFLRSVGLGYRAEYISESARAIVEGRLDLGKLSALPTPELKAELLKVKGVGDKVCNCITLFGFNRADSFPVDTWIEKIYREDFGGELKDRKKISQYFLDTFKGNSGYVQQYLFYAKREKFI